MSQEGINNSVNESNELLIVYDEYVFQVGSNKITDAVDYCYKIITTLGIDFPCECKHIWSFLTEVAYNSKETGKSYSAVSSLIKEINELKLASNQKNNIIYM